MKDCIDIKRNFGEINLVRVLGEYLYMDNEKISILREYFDWLKDDEFFYKFEVLDKNTCLIENEKIEILSLVEWEKKYNCEWSYDYESIFINGYVISKF